MIENFLLKFLKYKKICIQCHDNPDADALASGFALYRFYTGRGIETEFIYSGANQITKPNLLLMINELEIPIKYVTELPECDVLIMTDCQYGSGNVTRFDVPEYAVIDHHQCGILQKENYWVKSNLGSCSTVVWELMRRLDYEFDRDINLSTALHYGLYMDTGQFEEVFHPLDKDMKDTLKTKKQLLFRLVNTNLSLGELNIASEALSHEIYVPEYKFAIIPTAECDPNILGIISDFVIQVEEIDSCIAFNPNAGGYKLSIRSCTKIIKANELAEYICEELGNGGGHLTKAGGFIARGLLEEKFAGRDIKDVLMERMISYHNDFEVVYAKEYEINIEEFKKYRKKHLVVGVAFATDFLQPGTPVMVRSLEGDVNLTVEDDLYFMIGIEGEVYPIRREKFERSYRIAEDESDIVMEYVPNVRNNINGEIFELEKYMRNCMATGEVQVYAKPLDHNMKIFTAWDEDKYYRGLTGDYMVAREDDFHDVYIVRGDIFDKTYEIV